MPPRKSTQDAAQQDAPTFTTKDGRQFRLKPIDLLFLMTVQNSVKMPKPPTYEVKIGNRVEHYTMDEHSAKETPGGEKLWKDYRKALDEAQTEQGERMLRALIVEGTIPPADLWDDEWYEHISKWERRMDLIGIEVPKDPQKMWVDYLVTTLAEGDVSALTGAIMRLNNVPEELISAAEDAFRDKVQAD